MRDVIVMVLDNYREKIITEKKSLQRRNYYREGIITEKELL